MHQPGVAAVARPVAARDVLRVLLLEGPEGPASTVHQLARWVRAEVTAVDDSAALLVQASSTPFDAVVLQLPLPQIDGATVCRQLRTLGVVTPVLVIAPSGSVDDIIAALNAGADDFMIEPAGRQVLIARLMAFKRRQQSLAGQASAPAR